ncbi:glyoxylase-like metal-dependent hydrolase (beta-lactamase superfamily II) [Anaerosolibacter carboniphilus]|uniref:beta-lactamase n=1 Tax=Anaerosolibacter carboniphilus TaxID=1417629 RepID=A0A841KJJ0_9FIRM|nr:MBL fold metallo-hydrolase [Anaerosolibacter carboniphilus]MBB6214034.1 glyoxylase-like metal-dependent hydrolase (beta-lactamase superfamily II) [Anaerosolibacter carboniphilus]
MELKRIKDQIYYIPNVVNIGCIVNGTDAILVDTGLEDGVGKKIVNLLEKEGLTLRAVINTHSHADHFGGNAYIKEKTGAMIYAPAIEEAAIKYPYFEPMYLFSGANPVKELQNKFLMGKPSPVDYVIGREEQTLDVLGISLKILPLPGHSMNQIGIEIDDVLFCGDVFVAEEVLRKHKIPFNMDIQKHRETLHWLKGTTYEWYIPSHSGPIQDARGIAEINLQVLEEIDQCIEALLVEQQSSEELVQNVCDAYEIQCTNLGQYYLFHTTIMAHLGALSDQKKIRSQVENNRVYWMLS